jgi:hypothetical protein
VLAERVGSPFVRGVGLGHGNPEWYQHRGSDRRSLYLLATH